MRDAVIVDAVRTPIGRRNGALAESHPAHLSAHLLTALANRNDLDPVTVDDVIWGCVSQVGEQSGNVARIAALAAQWPETVPGTTVTRACGSSQQAVSFAAATVISGQNDVVVAGGVEVMSRVPMGSAGSILGKPYPGEVTSRYGVDQFSQGLGAEAMAVKWSLSRTELDEYALRSHALAALGTDADAFGRQIVPTEMLSSDEGIRRSGTLESLASLRPVFKEDGVIHAGNSSQISDGSGALLITTSENASKNGWKPVARVHTAVAVGDDPLMMLTAPIAATAKALARANLSIEDIGAFEINEAFAPVPVVWQKETGAAMSRTNPLGGAIATGHPLGGSGAILMTRLVHHMSDNGIRYGLQSMCEAGGMANATILELL